MLDPLLIKTRIPQNKYNRPFYMVSKLKNGEFAKKLEVAQFAILRTFFKSLYKKRINYIK